MPAKRPSRAGERRPSQEIEADPFNVDLSDIPMTPAMHTLHQAAKLRQQLRQAEQYLDDLVVDGSLLTLAEGQLMYSVMRAQGRPDTWRSQLTKLLFKRRGVNVAARDWRTRANRKITPEDVPSYIDADTLAALQEHIEPIAELIAAAEKRRKRQFPALLRRTKAAIEGPTINAEAV